MQPGTPGVGPGNSLVLPNGMQTGLEDFGVEDLKLPRLSIVHENGTFKDSLSNMEFPALTLIPLGVVKQRVLWRPVIEENNDAVPLCRSTDHQNGYPTTHLPVASENFPWQAALWNPADFPQNDEGRTILPCGSCRLKDWGSHPVDNKKTWCVEQHAIILLYGPDGAEPSMTAILTAQRSSINASKAFFASIMRRSMPAYAVQARLTLNTQMRGKNKYCVPVFMETGFTQQEHWPMYSESLASIRAFISRPPILRPAENTTDAAVVGQQNQMSGFQQQPTQPAQSQVIQAQSDPFGNNTWAPGALNQQNQEWPPQQPAQYQQPAPQQPAQYQQPAPQQPAQYQQPPQQQQYQQQPAPQQQYQQPASQQQYQQPASQQGFAPMQQFQPPPMAQMPPVQAPPESPSQSPAPQAQPSPQSRDLEDDDLPF